MGKRKNFNTIEEHVDLEEKFQISADIEFSFAENDYEGLEPIEIKAVKKKQEKKTDIQNVELRKSTGGLF